jgi:hypothetical protein
MSENRFIITTTLEGYINALKPAGKFNNCTISFRIPAEELPKFDACYEQCIAWGKNKMAGKRCTEELPKWQEDGSVKVSYGGEEGAPMFPWVDTDGVPVDIDTPVWKGTVVRLIIDLKPYVFGTKVGCSFKVKGAQVLKLVGAGGSDSGDLSTEDVAGLFGVVDGFKTGAPSFKPDQEVEDGPGYDDEDIPF